MGQSTPRDAFGARGRLFEAVVAKLFPLATLDWEKAQMHLPGGISERIEMSTTGAETWEGEGLLGVCLEFAERTEAAVEREITVAEATAGGRHAAIGVAARDDEGNISDVRVSRLDPFGDVAACLELRLASMPLLAYIPALATFIDASRYPVVEVNYRTLHEYEGRRGMIQWIGLRDLRTLEYLGRLPLLASLEGGIEAEQFEISRPEARVFEFEGLFTGGTWRYECPESEPCVIPAQEVLGWMSRPRSGR